MKVMLVGLAVVLTSFESFASIASEEDAEYDNYIQCKELITNHTSNLEFIYQHDRRGKQIESLKKEVELMEGLKISDGAASSIIDHVEGSLAGEVIGYLKFAREIYGSKKVGAIKVELYKKYQCQRFHKPVTP